MLKIRASAAGVGLFTLGSLLLIFAQGRIDIEQRRIQEIQRRMVLVVRHNRFPTQDPAVSVETEILGWIVAQDRVVTKWFPDYAILTVGGKSAGVLRSNFPESLVLLKVETGKPFGQIPTARLPRDEVLAIGRYEGMTVTAALKSPSRAFLDRNFLKLTVADTDHIGPGSGLFSRDGRLITIATGWEGPESRNLLLVADPRAFRAIIRPSQ